MTLEFKESDALKRGNEKEIAKDVSALANSAGGTIVYGIIEKDHVAAALDGGNSDPKITAEWLEDNLHGKIRPRLDGLSIKEIKDKHGSYFIVHVPQAVSNSPHMVENRYYKRFNYKAEPMEDYEVRDAMRRNTLPLLLVEVTKKLYQDIRGAPHRRVQLNLVIKNESREPALYSSISIGCAKGGNPNLEVAQGGYQSQSGSIDTPWGKIELIQFVKNLAVPADTPLYLERPYSLGFIQFDVPLSTSHPSHIPIFTWTTAAPGCFQQRAFVVSFAGDQLILTPLFPVNPQDRIVISE